MNTIVLTGRMLDNPARADTGKGIKATFQLDVDGHRQLRIPITAWNRLAGTCATYGRKDRKVAVTGRLDHDQYTAGDGARRDVWGVTAMALEFLDPPEPSKPAPGTTSTGVSPTGTNGASHA